MSSLPKQYNPILSSSSSRQHSSSRNNNNNNTTATGLTSDGASSRPQPIERNETGTDYEAPSLRINEAHHHHGVYTEDDQDGKDHNDEDETANHPDPTFKPFFTLIEDVNSSDYHHPTVHYIFSDDDPDLITEASLRALETGHDSPAPRNVQQQQQQHGGESSGEGSETGHRQSPNLEKPSLLPPPLPGVKDRFIILDVERTTTTTGQGQGAGGSSSAPDTTSAGTATTTVSTSPAAQKRPHQAAAHGYRITSAHSLTPDWQVLNTSLSLAPTFDTPQNTNDPDADPTASRGALMLRIEGTAGFRDITADKDRDAKGQQTLEEMMEQFDKRMSELRRVIEAGGDCPPPTIRPPQEEAREMDKPNDPAKEGETETREDDTAAATEGATAEAATAGS